MGPYLQLDPGAHLAFLQPTSTNTLEFEVSQIHEVSDQNNWSVFKTCVTFH